MISLSALLLGDPDAATIVQTFPKATVSDLKRTLAAELIGSTLSTRESNLLKLYNVEFENLLSSDARLRNADCVVEDVFPRAVLLDPFKTVASSFNGDLVQSDGRLKVLVVQNQNASSSVPLDMPPAYQEMSRLATLRNVEPVTFAGSSAMPNPEVTGPSKVHKSSPAAQQSMKATPLHSAAELALTSWAVVPQTSILQDMSNSGGKSAMSKGYSEPDTRNMVNTAAAEPQRVGDRSESAESKDAALLPEVKETGPPTPPSQAIVDVEPRTSPAHIARSTSTPSLPLKPPARFTRRFYYIVASIMLIALIIIGTVGGLSLKKNSSPDTLTPTQPGTLLQNFTGHTGGVTAMALSTDGTRLFTGSSDTTIQIWNTATAKSITTIRGHTAQINTMVLSPTTNHLFTAGDDGTIFEWDLQTMTSTRTFNGTSNRVYTLAVSPDGKQLFSGSGDGALRMWDITSGVNVRNFTSQFESIQSVVVSSNGTRLFSGGRSNSIQYFDVDRTDDVRVFSGHIRAVNSIVLSISGMYLFSGSQDSTIKMWDVSTGLAVRTFLGHVGEVFSVAVSADGKLLYSGGEDNTVKMWDVETGTNVRTFNAHTNNVNSVVLSKDGKFLYSASDDGTVKQWQL